MGCYCDTSCSTAVFYTFLSTTEQNEQVHILFSSPEFWAEHTFTAGSNFLYWFYPVRNTHRKDCCGPNKHENLNVTDYTDYEPTNLWLRPVSVEFTIQLTFQPGEICYYHPGDQGCSAVCCSEPRLRFISVRSWECCCSWPSGVFRLADTNGSIPITVKACCLCSFPQVFQAITDQRVSWPMCLLVCVLFCNGPLRTPHWLLTFVWLTVCENLWHTVLLSIMIFMLRNYPHTSTVWSVFSMLFILKWINFLKNSILSTLFSSFLFPNQISVHCRSSQGQRLDCFSYVYYCRSYFHIVLSIIRLNIFASIFLSIQGSNVFYRLWGS